MNKKIYSFFLALLFLFLGVFNAQAQFTTTCFSATNPTDPATSPLAEINPNGGTTSTNGIRIQITKTGNWQVQKANKLTSGSGNQLYNTTYSSPGSSYVVPGTSHGVFLTIGTHGFFGGTWGDKNGYKVLQANGQDYTSYAQLLPVSQSCTTTATTSTVSITMQAVVGTLTYTVNMVYKYTYANKFVTLTYNVTIPSGNTDSVRLSHFWDTQLEGIDAGSGFFNGTLGTAGSSVGVIRPCSYQEIIYRSGQAWSGYYSAAYDQGNAHANGNTLDKTIDPAQTTDNGLGISYNFGTTAGTYTSTNDVNFELLCNAPCTEPSFTSTTDGTYTCTTGFNLNSRVAAQTAPLEVRWYDAATDGNLVPDPTNVKKAGTYYAVIYDTTNNCSSPRTTSGITVTGPDATVTPTTSTITQPTCAVQTGSVLLTGLPTESTTIKAYEGTTLISTQTKTSTTATTYTFTGLTAGKTYTFTATSGTTCESAKSTTVTINAAPVVPSAPTVGTPTQPTCTTTTGSVSLSGLPASGTIIPVKGGVDQTAITITGTTQTVTGLAAGSTYTFKVSNGTCTSAASSSITINAVPTPPSAPTVGTITQPDCTTNTGSVALSGLPSSGTYTIIANDGTTDITTGSLTGTTYTFAGLPAGKTYTFKVKVTSTDCTSTASTSAAINAAPVATSISAQPLTTQTVCNGGSTTALSVTASGSGTLAYQWYSNSTNSTTGGTAVGTNSSSYTPPATNTGTTVQTTYYYVVVTGTCGTATSSTAAVVVRPTPTATISGTTATCQNSTPSPNVTFSNPQSIAVTVTYNINGGTSQTLNISANSSATVAAPTTTAGTFTYNLTNVVYQDTPTCSTAITGKSATITINALPTVTAVPTNVGCNGGSDGTVTLTGAGGTSPYTYSKDGTTYLASNLFTGLAAGTYTFYVKDNKGCTNTVSVTITQPAKIAATATILALNCSQVETTITIKEVTSITGGYQYRVVRTAPTAFDSGWVNSGSFPNLTQGTYVAYIREKNTPANCTIVDTLTPDNPCTQVTKTSDIPSTSSVSTVGSIINYTIIVANTGSVALKDVVVTDSKIPGFSATIASLPASGSPGSTQTLTSATYPLLAYTVTQADIDACAIVNTANFTGTTVPKGNTLIDSGTNTVKVTNTPSWTLTKSITSGATYNAVGNVIQYSIKLKNTGNTTIKGITVTDAKATLSSTYTGETGTAGELSPNEEWTYTASYTITASDIINACTYTNSATAKGTPYCGTLADATSNTVTSNKVIAAPTIGTVTQATCAAPKGSVVLSGLPASGTWTVTAYNGVTAVGTITGTDTSSASFNGLDAGATYTFKVAQPTGCESSASAGAALNALVGCACYEDPALDNTKTFPSKHGITLLKRAGTDNGGWPMIRQSAHTVLESNRKGFVITRMSTLEIEGQTSPTIIKSKIEKPVVGMMVYDTTASCLKIYTGDTANPWKCFQTAACPN